MGRIYEAVKSYFDADEWSGEEVDDGVLAFRFESEAGDQWGCLAVAVEDAEQFVFYSVRLEPMPAARRAEATELIMRANHGMQVGNFEMDLADGEIRFKTSIDVEGSELTAQLCRNMVDLNLMIMGVYFDGFTAVSKGDKSAADVIEELESGPDDDDDDDSGES